MKRKAAARDGGDGVLREGGASKGGVAPSAAAPPLVRRAAAEAAAAPAGGGGPVAYSVSAAMVHEVRATCGRARMCRMTTPHYACQLPMFMPVGTQGTVKGLTAGDLEEAGVQLILGNAYHLEQRPGAALVRKMGGLHKFESWRRAMLTDSGGFQMVSLSDLLDVSEDAVRFQDPATGAITTLSPEKCMEVQNNIGADIMMALDDVVSSTANDPKRYEEATYRTTRWLKRCIDAHARPNEQSLFGIVQGGLDVELRRISCEELVPLNLPGYAVGGLSGGEDKHSFWRCVDASLKHLPANKPRYVMGVGYPVDIVVCVALGADMFDCVYPTRTARFGTAMVPTGLLRLRGRQFADDMRPIEAGCDCATCKRYTRSYLHSLATREGVAASLVSVHNVRYLMRLTERMRASITEGTFPKFVNDFLRAQFIAADAQGAVPYEKPDGTSRVPSWVKDALAAACIQLDADLASS